MSILNLGGITMDEPRNQDEQPEVYAVNKREGDDWQFARRDFMKAAGVAAAAGLLSGCTGEPQPTATPTPDATPTPRPTRTPEPTPTPDPFPTGENEPVAHKAGVTRLAVSPDGTLLLSGCSDSRDMTLKLWSLTEGALLNVFEYDPENPIDAPRIGSVAFGPDSSYFVAGRGVWQLPDFTRLAALSAAGNEIALSADGAVLAHGDDDGEVHAWSMPDATLLGSVVAGGDYVSALAISPDGAILASGSTLHGVKLWALPDMAEVGYLGETTGQVTDLAFSPDGTLLAAGNRDGDVVLWAVADEELLATLPQESGWIQKLAFSSDGTRLYVGIGKGINVLSIPDGELLQSFHEEGYTELSALVLTADDRYLITGHRASMAQGGSIRVWELPNLEVPAFFLIDLAANQRRFSGAQYSPGDSGDRIVTLPCGSPIPAGATCICNCVAGESCSCVGNRGGSGGHYWYPN